MSARGYANLVLLVLALAGIGVAALFWVQNSARAVMLSLNLGVTRFMLAEPVSLPLLMLICLGIGFVVGAVAVLILRIGGRRRSTAPSYDASAYSSSAYSTTTTTGDRG